MIDPALTPDEWADFLSPDPSREVPRVTHVIGPDARRRHAVAAKLIYDMPFGFSRKQVHTLRLLAHAAEGVAGQGHVDRLRDLADILESYLPPDGT